MKFINKLSAAITIAAIMIITVLPVCAADALSESEKQDINRAYWKVFYDTNFSGNPDAPDFNEFLKEHPIDEIKYFRYYGRYGEGSYPVIYISGDAALGLTSIIAGKYYFDFRDWGAEDDRGELISGLLVYDGEKLMLLSKAYADGLLSGGDLDTLYADGRAKSITDINGKTYPMMRLNGDMDSNGQLDVNDMIALKGVILRNVYQYCHGELDRQCGDMNRDGYLNINDIMALKTTIIRQSA